MRSPSCCATCSAVVGLTCPNRLALGAAIAVAIWAPLLGGAAMLLGRNVLPLVEAYELYLQGRAIWKRRGEENIRRAIERYNIEASAEIRAQRLGDASRKVRAESMRINAEFAAAKAKLLG